MKRVRICSLLLAVMLVFSIGVCLYTAQFTGELLLLCERAEKESSAAEYAALQKTVSELNEKFSGRSDFLELFLRRELITAPQDTLQTLTAYARPDTAADFEAELARAKGQIAELREVFLGFT